MAAHIGVDSTFGVTQPSDTELTKASRSSSVPTFKTPGHTGEIFKYTAGRTKNVQVTLEGSGTAPVASVAVGDGITPSTLTLISARQGERNTQGLPTFSAMYSAAESFADSDNAETAPSAVPDLDTIEIVSVDYSLTESLDITSQITDRVIADLDGTPGFRGTFGKESSFTLSGYGDLPVALGENGAGVARLTGGKLILESTEEIENAQDCNQWRASGGHCPSAT